MPFDPELLADQLNRASLDLVMLSSDNLLELSSVLGQLKAMEENAGELSEPEPGAVLTAMTGLIREMIRDKVPDRDLALGLVGDGLSLMQEMARSIPVGQPVAGDVKGLIAKIKAAIALDPPTPSAKPPKKSKSKKPEGSKAASQEPELEPEPTSASAPSGEPEAGSELEAGAPEEPSSETEDGLAASSETAGSPTEPTSPEVNAAEGSEEFSLGRKPKSPFKPRKIRLDPTVIVPTPTQVRREAYLSQKLTVDYFKADFTGALEDLQMKLVAVEHKTDPVAAMSETLPLFRTILGGFSLLELDDLAQLTADTIALLDYVSTEQVPHTTAITDILLKACSYLINGLATLTLNQSGRTWSIEPLWTEEELSNLRENLWEARQGMLTNIPTPGATSGSGGASVAKPKKLGEILVEKGLITQNDLGGLIQAQKSARAVRLGEILVQDGLITEEELNEALERQQTVEKGRRLGEILVSMGRVEHEHVEEALKRQESLKETKLGEILLKRKIGAPEKVAAALREQKRSEGGATQTAGTQTVKVETQKLDGLIDLVGELVITQSLVTSNQTIKFLKEQKIIKDLAQVSRITSELQRNAMSLRMVQISQTFRKMNRLVRDLAHKFEKDVEMVTTGEDTEIDRNMVESIHDPLVHMIRNCLDHGLESPQERRAAGKPPKGVVSLKAYHQGGNVVIELSDDGRGLDRQKVVARAIENGLISSGDNLSTQAIHNLVFHPGFSTKDLVTDISGRGLGMDVVRKSVEVLRGKVDFTSEPGQGSTTTIRLPLTLAIIDGMIVRVGDYRYILPTISINESFRPKPEEYFTVKNQGEMIKVRDALLPLVRLSRIVAASGAMTDPAAGLVVVVENEGQRCCLLVDEVLGKQEVVIKSLGETLKYVRSLAGGTILGDGRVGLILDVSGLFEAREMAGGAPSPAGRAADDWEMGDESWK
ncbi:MAG: chemotaxis protein CheW [Deltaproteobacteria bacterium]|jgi:chemotaxis protein histidine kinase CheA|nr:chemotaxis protein CheW [Deltaproteobacteria bacterium]